jgi:hypothetical protein
MGKAKDKGQKSQKKKPLKNIKEKRRMKKEKGSQKI